MQTTEARREHAVQLWRDAALRGAHLASARYSAHHFERHVHDELVIAVTESGAAQVQTRLGSDVGGPATVWIFRPGEYHCGSVWQDAGWRYRGIYLDRAGLDHLAQTFAPDDTRELALREGLHRDPQLARLLLQAHRCTEDDASELERQARWWAAFGLLFGRYGDARPSPGHGSERPKMERVREYLAANFARNVSIDELSTMSGLGRYHLMRAFAREYGMPPHAYTNQLRLAEARRLIALGRSLSDAAAAAGFYDQSHLTRLFKRAYDVTPGVYARLHDTSSPAAVTRTNRGDPAGTA